jgi:hypothetical protein
MIKGDSTDYSLLAKWADQLSPRNFYLTVEIGVREGYGSHVIMENLKNKNHFHIGIDPYGDITYEHLDPQPGISHRWKDSEGNILYNSDGSFKTPTYPSSMKQTFLTAFNKHENFILYQLEDIEYFNAFGQGVPIYYQGQKKIMNTYDFVHFDGPHTTAAVLHEALFFANRSNPGTRFVFDDVGTYDIDSIQQALTHYDFYLMERGQNKICLERSNGLQKS